MLTMADRGTPVVLPEWWLKSVRDAVSVYEGGMATLGRDLAQLDNRATAWSHSTLSRFLRGENCTIELADALSRFLQIPPAFYVARSLDEASQMLVISRKFASRIRVLDKELEQLEQHAKDQTDSVEDADASEVNRGRGVASVGRSGKSHSMRRS